MSSEKMPDDEIFNAEPVDQVIEPVTASPRPPRLWTVFVAFPVVLLAMIGSQILGALIVLLWQVGQGADVQAAAKDLPAKLTQPIPFMIFTALAQVMVLLGAIVPALLSRERATSRLGLLKPVLPWWSYPIVAIGTIFPLAIGLVPAYFLSKVMEPNHILENLYQQMDWQVAVPFILFIAISPGITEELFFRGYMQTRLLKRWSPWLAILVTSVLFALIHIEPRQVLYVFPVGIWLGVVAWRTGSVWPGMLCHAFLNGSLNLFQIGSMLTGAREEETSVLALCGVGLGFVCFCVSIWILSWDRKPIADHPSGEYGEIR